MNKSIVAGVVALVLVILCGVWEVILINTDYNKLHSECVEVMQMAKTETLTSERFGEFRRNWVSLRETSELLLPHNDVYELNLRFAESQAYIDEGDYKQLLAQLSVIEELLNYVPHLMTPNLNHLV